MNALLAVLLLALCAWVSIFVPTFGAPAIVVCVAFAGIVALIISQTKSHTQFLLRLFVFGLLIRMLIGTVIFVFGLQDFFGGDANTYDFYGYALLKVWSGDRYYQTLVSHFIGSEGASGWGMIYLVATVYSLIGRNMLAIQFINAVIGAATAPVIFLCAQHLFNNFRVARIAALFVTLYPSLVLWSSQGLKDGPIVFLLAVSILATLRLGDKFSVNYLLILVCSLLSLLTMRFYVFYIMLAAIGGAFVVGMRAVTAQSFVRQFVVIIAIGLSLTYLGVLNTASRQLETYGNLETIQRGRLDAAQTGKSGFYKDIDVSTNSGALLAVPIGLAYLLFAPFPWQISSFRQAITLPEMLIWWTCVPLLVLGAWFTAKYRLRQASPILIFTAMLTLSYSVFQGNVGNAYRQRAQLLVFYFIFVAVGLVLLKERRERRKGSS